MYMKAKTQDILEPPAILKAYIIRLITGVLHIRFYRSQVLSAFGTLRLGQ